TAPQAQVEVVQVRSGAVGIAFDEYALEQLFAEVRFGSLQYDWRKGAYGGFLLCIEPGTIQRKVSSRAIVHGAVFDVDGDAGKLTGTQLQVLHEAGDGLLVLGTQVLFLQNFFRDG